MSSGGPRKKGGGLLRPRRRGFASSGTLVWPTSFTVEVMRRFTNYTEGATGLLRLKFAMPSLQDN